MAVPTPARVFLLALLFAASAVEAFVATAAVRAPCLSRSPRVLFSRGDHQLTRTKNTATTLPRRSRQTPAAALAMSSSSSYDQGSSDLSTGGDMGGSTEMELQELIVDFTDDGRILLEVKGVKVGWVCNLNNEDAAATAEHT